MIHAIIWTWLAFIIFVIDAPDWQCWAAIALSQLHLAAHIIAQAIRGK